MGFQHPLPDPAAPRQPRGATACADCPHLAELNDLRARVGLPPIIDQPERTNDA